MSEILEVLYQWSHGVGQRKIHRSLGLSRNTIKGIIKQAEKLGLSPNACDEVMIKNIYEQISGLKAKEKKPHYPVDLKLEPYREKIKHWLETPSMTVIQIYRLLTEMEPPVHLGINSLHRYIHRHFKDTPKATMNIPTIAGEQAQVDFGAVGLMKECGTGKYKKAYVFVMTLSHSRYRFIYFVFRQDVQTWIDCHRRAFNFFGGVPKTILLDNLKAGVIKPDIYDPTINRSYAEMERHYGFVVDPAKVRTPEHKGKVERSVTIVKQQVVAGREFFDINDANEYGIRWCTDEISERVTRTTGEKPRDRFIRDEKEKLLPLPKDFFECPVWSDVKVGRDQHVCFYGSFYSVPEKYIEQTLSVRATPTIVQFYQGISCIKTHPAATAKGQWVTDFNDLNPGAQHYLKITPEYCLKQASVHGEATLSFFKSFLKKPSITRLRKAGAILRLADIYGSSRLESACLRALSFGSNEYKALVNILDKGLDLQPLIKKSSPSHAELCVGAFLRDPSEFTVH